MCLDPTSSNVKEKWQTKYCESNQRENTRLVYKKMGRMEREEEEEEVEEDAIFTLTMTLAGSST